jgi:hypothetical protein
LLIKVIKHPYRKNFIFYITFSYSHPRIVNIFILSSSLQSDVNSNSWERLHKKLKFMKLIDDDSIKRFTYKPVELQFVLVASCDFEHASNFES